MDTSDTAGPTATGRGGIFVLGLQRSGTTWVANMLAGSGAVAAIAAEDHRGVHESVFFSHFAQAFGPLSNPSARALFRDAFLKSDYYILTGLDADFLDRAIATSTDHADVFDKVMSQVAQDHGCAHWLEKSPHHTRLAAELAARLPEARFVCILRDSRTLVMSRLAAYGRMPPAGATRMLDIVRGALSNALASRRLLHFAAGCDRALVLRYEDFLDDPHRARSELARFLELQADAQALVSAFAPNTSHDRAIGTRIPSPVDRIAIMLGDRLGALLPIRFLERFERQRRAKRGIDWPDWVWRRSGWHPAGATPPHASRHPTP